MQMVANIPRYPIAAEKDPRVDVPKTPAADWNAEPVFSTDQTDDLIAIAFRLCPHDWLERSHYRTVVMQICADRERLGRMRDALIDLCERTTVSHGCRFSQLWTAAQVEALEQVQDQPFFREFLNATIRYLYDNPVVWAGCGYEGIAGCQSDGIRNDLDDIDWIPRLPNS